MTFSCLVERCGRFGVVQRALAAAGLTLPQFNVLMELAATQQAALPMYELNARLVATAPNTSWLSTRMAQAGLVDKRRDAGDARVVVLSITEAGWGALERALPRVVDAERQLFADYRPEELRLLADLLGRLTTWGRARGRGPEAGRPRTGG